MGCVSSRLDDPALNAAQDNLHYTNFGRPNHLVCLTSTTYGLLSRTKEDMELPIETINAWELMEGLEDLPTPPSKRSPQFNLDENQAPKPFKDITNRNGEDKENIGRSPAKLKRRISHGPLTDLTIDTSAHFDSFDGGMKSSSSPLFDPELLASFEASLEGALQKRDPLEGFEAKCPPGGQEAVVLYTTTLRGIRKTFEDCNSVRSVVESYGVRVSERDVWMHLGFRKEAEELMGGAAPLLLPNLFIKGRFIGGAQRVMELHEQGKLGELLEGMPRETPGRICEGCGGVRFVPCFECSGSCKLLNQFNTVMRCPECNENGLIHCPICC